MKRTAIGQLILDLPEPYQDINFFHRPRRWTMEEHYHDYYQMIMVTGGVLVLNCKQTDYFLTRGQLCIIPPGCAHSLNTETGYDQFGINLNAEKDSKGLITLLDTYIEDFIIMEKSDLLDLIPKLEKECQHLTKLSKLKLANILDSILLTCVESTTNLIESDFRNRLVTLLSKNLSNRLNLKTICKEMAVSRSSLERWTNKEFGCGVIELFNQLRINKACSLLVNSQCSIGEISEQLGFYDQAHFSHFFKQKTSLSPSQFRKKKDTN